MYRDELLERAKQCLKLAEETPDAELKASLTDAAQRWERLAAESSVLTPELPWVPQF